MRGNTLYMGDNNALNLSNSGFYMFARRNDGHVWEAYSTLGNPWHWSDLSAPTGTSASAVDGTIYVGDNNASDLSHSKFYTFPQAANGHLYALQSLLGGAWQWNDLGAPSVGSSSTTVASGVGSLYMGDNNSNLANSRLYDFVIGADGHVWVAASLLGGAWQWADLGAPPGTTASVGLGTLYMGDNNAASLSGSRFYAFVGGADGHIRVVASLLGGGWQWSDLQAPSDGSSVSGGVGTIYMGDNNAADLSHSQFVVFLIAADNHLWKLASSVGSPWQWADMQAPGSATVSSGVGTIYMGDNVATNLSGSRFYAMVKGSDGNLYTDASLLGGAWQWTNLNAPAGYTVQAGVGTIYMGDNNAASLAASRFLAFVQVADNGFWADASLLGNPWQWASLQCC